MHELFETPAFERRGRPAEQPEARARDVPEIPSAVATVLTSAEPDVND